MICSDFIILQSIKCQAVVIRGCNFELYIGAPAGSRPLLTNYPQKLLIEYYKMFAIGYLIVFSGGFIRGFSQGVFSPVTSMHILESS